MTSWPLRCALLLAVALACAKGTDPGEPSPPPPTGPPNALNGRYAFVYDGFDDTGERFSVAGSFLADGHGNITDGVEDVNAAPFVTAAVPITGSYSLRDDGRGTMTLKTAKKTTNYAFAVGPSGSAAASRGNLIEFDDTNGTTGMRGAGSLRLQDATSFSLVSIAGSYAFGLGGDDSVGGPFVAVGTFDFDASGQITGGSANASDYDVLHTGIQLGGALARPDSKGRIDGSLVTSVGTLPFAAYVVSANELIFFSLLRIGFNGFVGSLTGPVRRRAQSAFDNSSLKGVSVFYSVVGTPPSFYMLSGGVAVGVITFAGDGTGTATYDMNGHDVFSAQVGTPIATATTGFTYAVEANGRVTNLPPGAVAGESYVYYLVGPNEGFSLHRAPGSPARGYFAPQRGAPFSAASISATYLVGMSPPAHPKALVFSGEASAGAGQMTSIVDTSASTGVLSSASNLSLGYTVSANGRVALGGQSVGYLVDGNQLWTIGIDSTSPQNQSIVTIFER